MAFKPSFNAEKGIIKVLVRLSFCRIFEKTASFENGSLKYRTNGLLYKNTPEGDANRKVVNQAIAHMVKTKWPKRAEDLKKFRDLLDDGPKGRWPLHDGDKYFNDEGDVREGYEGTHYLKLTNDRKVKVRDRRGNEVDDDEKFEMFQSGHWAIAYLHLFPVTDQKKGGNGMFATLDALQYYKADEVFSGGGMSDEEIDDYGEEDDNGGDDLGDDDDDLDL